MHNDLHKLWEHSHKICEDIYIYIPLNKKKPYHFISCIYETNDVCTIINGAAKYSKGVSVI